MTLRIPPIFLVVICGLIALGATAFFPQLDFKRSIVVVPAVILISSGSILLALSVAAFVKARTTVNPLKPEEATQLVTQGLYRISRNPMYLAMAFLLFGGALLLGNFGALLAPALFVIAITQLQIKPEERILRAHFGQAYDDYCEKTGRWF